MASLFLPTGSKFFILEIELSETFSQKGSLTLTADALFSDLTEKQMNPLLTAYSDGYCNLPRKANVQDIASKKRVSKTTYHEHLKKAENKLVASLVPYVQLFKRVTPEKRRESSTTIQADSLER